RSRVVSLSETASPGQGERTPQPVATSIPQPTAVTPGCHGVIDHSLYRCERLHRLFEASADATADNVAIAYGDDHVTYCELESRANQLARHLASHGIGRGQRVGILLNRS